jgi:FkbM family methyltransferase
MNRTLTTYLRQFSPWNVLRFILSDVAVRTLDGGRRRAYSQTGEDLALSCMLRSEPGFYVDVGCNHPTMNSNTFALYKTGWRGICIDANPRLIEEFKRLRPRDVSLCAAVSDEEKEVVFTDFVNDAVSSLEADHVATWRANTAVAGQRIVRTRTLGAILHDLDAPRAFDLLSIDVEGHDANVLRSIDLDVYQPQVIVVEMRGFDISAPREHDIYRYLTARRYRLGGFLVLNGYFMRSDDPSARRPEPFGSD